MKGFLIVFFGLIGRIVALAVVAYFFYSFFYNKWFQEGEPLTFFVDNKTFLIGGLIALGVGTFLSTIDGLRKLFSVRFLKGLIILIFSVGFVAAGWFMYNNIQI